MKDRPFEALSPAEQRVAIASDVVSRIRGELILPESMTYLSFEARHDEFFSAPADMQVSEFVTDKQCAACAVGSMFVAAVAKFDDLTFEKLRARDSGPGGSAAAYKAYLEHFFESDVLYDLEAAFEGWDDWKHSGPGDEKERLLAIMQNIVDNKGEFTLTPETFK